jgi:uncharacterized spore protein YtfJ
MIMFELAIIVAVITGVGQVVKNFVPSKFMPIVSLILGAAAGIAFVDASLQEQIFVGLAMGLAASGLFDIAKLPTKK